MTISHVNLMELSMFKFKPVPPAIGALIATVTALTAVMAAEASGQETLQVERAGTAGARTVILVPGLATPGAVWDGTVAQFESAADMHLVTLAGFGGVAPAERSAGVIETAVADLAALIDRAELTDAVIVGHSMGGQVALQLAAARPDAVTDVVVVDSAPFFRPGHRRHGIRGSGRQRFFARPRRCGGRCDGPGRLGAGCAGGCGGAGRCLFQPVRWPGIG
jgi:pimeloyl-ACP methyl ester carboxylesterase